MFDTLVQWLVVTPAKVFGNFESLFLLGVRLWVSWDFLKSGWLKVTNWQNTLFLFQNEYHTPVLPPRRSPRSWARPASSCSPRC